MNNDQNTRNSAERNPAPAGSPAAKMPAMKPKPNVKLGQKLYGGMGWRR